MADFGVLFAVIAKSSSLALELYKLDGASLQGSERGQLAKSINNFSYAVKQLGTFLREDDTLLSPEAAETLEDVLGQGRNVLDEIAYAVGLGDRKDSKSLRNEATLSTRPLERLVYLQSHLDALRTTIVVLQQTLYTAQIIIWARVRPTISPQVTAAAVANEKMQLENGIIEQQVSILAATRSYQHLQPDVKLLTEEDSAKSLMAREHCGPSPADLHKYQERFLTSLETSDTGEDAWLPAVCGFAISHVERLLERWTRLHHIQENFDREHREMEAQKRETQQATVESDGEADRAHGFPHRPGSVQPLFTDLTAPPVSDGMKAPVSPASIYGSSPQSSADSVASSTQYSSTFLKTDSLVSPLEAAAAVEAKEDDEEASLEIPWKLCARRYWWRYIDNRVIDSNTDQPTSTAFSDRASWTEIMASWVCKEAIEEQGYEYKSVQKERQDGRRTKFEACFCIQQPLTFNQVQRLVERTVEIYRNSRPPSPPLTHRRSSFNDRDRTPVPAHKSTARPSSMASYPYAPPPPPTTKERTATLPGRTVPPLSVPRTNTNLSLQPDLYNGQGPRYIPPQATQYPSSTYLPPSSPSFAITTAERHLHPPHPQPSSHRDRNSTHRKQHLSITSSDSDTAARRRHRSRSRRPSTSSQKSKKKHSTVGTLVKAGGLVALLDGISDLGIL